MTKDTGRPPRCWDYLHEVGEEYAGGEGLLPGVTMFARGDNESPGAINHAVTQAGCERIPRGVGDPLRFCLRWFLREYGPLATPYHRTDFELSVFTVAEVLGVSPMEASSLLFGITDHPHLAAAGYWPATTAFWSGWARGSPG
jgi:hypothetical protein